MVHIESGPENITFNYPLRFRRRTRSNPYSFDDFLQALRSSRTIRSVECHNHEGLGITESEWCRLVQTFSSIRGLTELVVAWQHGSLHFHPLQAIADAVDSAALLEGLGLVTGNGLESMDPNDEAALAQSLRRHAMLCVFGWKVVRQSTTRIPLLIEAAAAGTSLLGITLANQNINDDDIRNLVNSSSLRILKFEGAVDSWLVVANEIQNGRFRLQKLVLTRTRVSSTLATSDAIDAIIEAIEQDSSLEHLTLRSTTGFTDEMGVALAKALTVNTTLRGISVVDEYDLFDNLEPEHPRSAFGAKAFKALASMLKTNTKVEIDLPQPRSEDTDKGTRTHFFQYVIEYMLNKAGRGTLLSSNLTTRRDWINALDDMNVRASDNECVSEFHLSCVYSMLQLNPNMCQGDTA
jgi:hypothetical protein